MPALEEKPARSTLPTNTVILAIVAALLAIALILSGNLPWARHNPHSGLIAIAKGSVAPTGFIPTALYVFRLEIGRYPTTAEGLHSLVVKPSTLTEPEATKWHKYLGKQDMLMDPWLRTYGYKCPGDRNRGGYDLWSNGPDRIAGTLDDICNWPQDGRQ